ncbi:MAG: pilus assembly protein N-terminal domain-containing protein, partial [Burkholderiaceae bacterium]|nr:pilus assembly protein N-terminal domain-containing protein [Burkholderiaceae bacterium]
MSTFRTGAKPTALHLALAMTGVIGMVAASTLAHGQVAMEAGMLAPTPPAKTAAKPTPKTAMKVAQQADTGQLKSVVLPARAPITGKVELAPQVNLSEGKSTLMRLPSPASRLSVGDARIADVILLNPSEVYMLGKSVGSTNLIIWNRANDATIIDIAVGVDTVALRAHIVQLIPGEKDIIITTAADTVILSGTVSDAVKADQVMALANAYVQRSARSAQAGRAGGGGAAAPAAGAAPAAAAPAGGTGGGGQSSAPKVVNMMSIAAPQQVMLEVKVAEVSKSLVDQLGASVSLSRIGTWTTSLLSNLLTNSASILSGTNNRNGDKLSLDAQKRDGLVKVLAEPNIMAISGQEASFLAGGKIFIPTSQTNSNGVATPSLEEKEFGVGVKFTPTVLEGGRINLKVLSEVSDLNKEGVGITATGTSTTAILPSFTTRRASTTVQLFDGQSFAIGGLIKNNIAANIKAVPGLGEVPVLGA